MGIKAPEFWITTDEMIREGLPAFFDYLRFQKGASDVPFICIHTDETFLQMLSLENVVWPDDMDMNPTTKKVTSPMEGVYNLKVVDPVNPRISKNMTPVQTLSSKEAFLEHLKLMREQKIDWIEEEEAFKTLLSRDRLKKEHLFSYRENLDFSIMQLVADKNPLFPQQWNFNNIPGPLKSVCQHINEILGVSTAMIYAASRGNMSPWHVEDGDLPSGNVLFPGSAGKGWIGVHPEDQFKLDALIAAHFRKTCVSPLHKDLILDVDFLDEYGIRWYWIIQRPGDIILTNPAGPHQVVNLGYNLAEATNFYATRTLVTSRRRVACQCPARVANFSADGWNLLATFIYSGEFRFLCRTNGIPVPTPEEVLSQIVETLTQNNITSSQEGAPRETPTVKEVIERWTQARQQRVTVQCQITSSQPLTLADLSPAESSQPEPAKSAESSQPEPAHEPAESSQPEPAESSQPEPTQSSPSSQSRIPSPILFQTPSPIKAAPKRRRLFDPFEDPSQKAKRINNRADYYSQRNYDEREAVSSEPGETQTPNETDPRINQTNRINSNLSQYSKYTEARRKASEKYFATHERKVVKNKKASAYFKDYLQRATRKIETASERIALYASRGTQPRNCSWETKLQNATEIKRNLESRRLLYNVLQTMYRYCLPDLQERLDEGYLEQEIFRDFVQYQSTENRDLFLAALKVHGADLEHWNAILEDEAAWNKEFGLDSRYRIPCIEFSKLKFDVLDFL